MAITATAPPTRTQPLRQWLTRARTALAPRVRQAAAMVSAARHRARRPALTISGFASIDTAAFHTLGTGAGLLTLGILLLVFEWLGGEQ